MTKRKTYEEDEQEESWSEWHDRKSRRMEDLVWG